VITYLAMRPTVPTPAQVPFEVPDSVRLIDPTLPEGATLTPPPPAGWFDPDGVAITEILNHTVNFGWEYVWHCHILSHEEMDMMHSLVFAVPPRAPTGLSATMNGSRVNLAWTDNSSKEAGFSVQRASNAGFTTGLRTFNVGPNVKAFSDNTVANGAAYWYRVFATGAPVGDLLTPGFPTMAADSTPSNTATITVAAADTVSIVNATYNASTQTLTVLATSSAQPNVTLTAVGFGRLSWNPTLGRYQRNFSPVAAPASVTVTSSGGGSATQTVPFP